MALLDCQKAPHGGKVRLLSPENEDAPNIKPRLIILHTIVGDAQGATDYFEGSNVGVESTVVIAGKWYQTEWPDGYFVQLMDTTKQADANYKANPFAVSFETEDGGDPETQPWTPKQLDAIVWGIREVARIHDIPLKKATAWDGTGIGYHTMFPQWTNVSGKTCPGAARKAQFDEILRRVQEEDMPHDSDDNNFMTKLRDETVLMLTTGAKSGDSNREYNNIAKVHERLDYFEASLIQLREKLDQILDALVPTEGRVE